MITEEQRKKRMEGLGASDSPIVMGYSKFKTPYQLYLEKRGMVTDEDEMSEQQYWGNALEPAILKRFEEQNGVIITHPDTIYHPEHKFIFANLDGWIESERAVVEAKCANSFQRKDWDLQADDGIPLGYLVQLAKQCFLADAVRGYCAVLIGGNEYRQYTYERDMTLENIIIASDIRFWEYVTEGIEPDPINTNDCRLKYRIPQPDRIVESNYRTTQAHHELQSIKEKIKELGKLEEHFKMQVMQHMGTAEYLLESDGEIIATWKANKKGTRVLNLKG